MEPGIEPGYESLSFVVISLIVKDLSISGGKI